MILCDNKYKYGSFFLAGKENLENIEKGKFINLSKVSPKKIKNVLFIRIKEYEILNDSKEIENIKDITYKDGIFNDGEIDVFVKIEEKPKTEEKIEEVKNSNIQSEEESFTSLKQLTTFSTDFIIFICVTKKSKIKTFETRNNNMNTSNQRKFFYFILLDRDGNDMQCLVIIKQLINSMTL